jgi:hypothetical protein
MAADANGWPAVVNADDIVNKRIVENTRAIYDKFRKQDVKPVKTTGNVDRSKMAANASGGGIDAERLATDSRYYAQVRDMKDKTASIKEREAWYEKVEDMRVKAMTAIVSKRK